MLTETMYAIYIVVSIAMTIWVARTLHKNGRIFLVESFHGNAELADSVNRLLVVGFYLVNIGFVLMWLRTEARITDTRILIETLSKQLGIVLLVLGAMHFINLIVFANMRANARFGVPRHSSYTTPPRTSPPTTPG